MDILVLGGTRYFGVVLVDELLRLGHKVTISIREIMNYVEEKTGKKAILTNDGEAGSYNGVVSYRVNINKASELGFEFTDIKEWIFELLDELIEGVFEGIME